jgi:hypothetical protein
MDDREHNHVSRIYHFRHRRQQYDPYYDHVSAQWVQSDIEMNVPFRVVSFEQSERRITNNRIASLMLLPPPVSLLIHCNLYPVLDVIWK